MCECRRNSNLSFAKLEARTGVSRGVLQKLESGNTEHAAFKTVKALESVLGYTFEVIIQIYRP
ncbi:helix-turn-helix domain-containing protein [Brevibacillus sp. M2.1A]|uniref:helix-turn-helix domain-containing protein n=1 Tax=Brevibacillus TaxID=55080 RepID=UPI001E37C236|nr:MULTISPECIES: helix-turn-helix transcriptional regulator [Brevibacillus]MCC8433322.1 helix-turn-helix domain-containing protein [Brevibacillus sp. M2.1A]